MKAYTPSYPTRLEQRDRILEVLFGLARETNNHISCDADGPARGANPRNFFEIFLARVGAPHGAQNARRAGLDRKMNVVAERGRGVDRVDDLATEIIGMRSGEAHAADAMDCRDLAQQAGEIQAARRRIAIGIDGLAEQLNFGIAGIGEAASLG